MYIPHAAILSGIRHAPPVTRCGYYKKITHSQESHLSQARRARSRTVSWAFIQLPACAGWARGRVRPSGGESSNVLAGGFRILGVLLPHRLRTAGSRSRRRAFPHRGQNGAAALRTGGVPDSVRGCAIRGTCTWAIPMEPLEHVLRGLPNTHPNPAFQEVLAAAASSHRDGPFQALTTIESVKNL